MGPKGRGEEARRRIQISNSDGPSFRAASELSFCLSSPIFDVTLLQDSLDFAVSAAEQLGFKESLPAMDLIKAFVGHSFTEEDSEVIDRFLKFFAQLEKMNTNFSWVHAEAAEPKQLTEKVMALIQDRNLFIGICTKKELVVAPSDLSAVPLVKKQIANTTSFLWKTSDWIIQEIGLAKGRGLETLLLIENGVRKPGGLQGDVEYISFDRTAPEISFGKIVEMITALSPKTAGTVTVISSPTSPASDIENEVASTQNDWRTPSPSWEKGEYDLAMFHFILLKEDAGAKKIDEAFLATPAAQNTETVAAWKARNLSYRLMYGKGGDLKALESLAAEFPDNDEVLEFYAQALSKFEKHLDAASEYEIAAGKTKDINDKTRLLGFAATEYAREGKLENASVIIKNLRQSLRTSEISESQFLAAFRRYAEAIKDKDLLIALLERWVDLFPDDFRVRFSLAYMHSEIDNDDVALNHYLKIPFSERNAIDWNNLGVAFQHFKLPVKAINAYRKSEEMNETLAMANLGYMMLSAGLLPEAQAICDKALAIKGYHKNVGQLLVRLNDASSSENKTQEEVLAKSKPKIEFYRCFGRAVSLAEPKEIEGVWVGPESTLNIKVSNGQIEITGTYERERNPFGVGIGMLSISQKVQHRIEYHGTLKGRAIQAVVKRTGGESLAATALFSSPEGTKALMYVSDDETEINLIENPSAPYSHISVIKRPPIVPVLSSPMQ